MWKIKTYQWMARFFATIFVLSIILFFVGLASMKMSLNWNTQDDMDRGNKYVFVAAIGLLISYPLTSWLDKKARKLLKEKYPRKYPDPSDHKYPTNEKCMDLPPRDKPLKGKGQ